MTVGQSRSNAVLVLPVAVCVYFPHDETQRTYKRGKSNNDYPFHYTLPESAIDLPPNAMLAGRLLQGAD